MSRKRLGLGSTLLIFMASLVLPAATAAAFPYTYEIERNRCTTTGGAYDHGFVKLQVRMTEWGKSATNYFRIKTKVQAKVKGTTTWMTISTAVDRSETFPNDVDSWWWSVWRRYDFTAYEQANFYHRLQMVLQWWDQRDGPDVLLSQQTVNSRAC